MEEKKKQGIFILIIIIASIIIIAVGSTFAYFSITINSEEGSVSAGSAIFDIDLVDDIDLIKTNLIPSEERYVDIATQNRVDADKNFLKPTEVDGKLVTEGTACIDDNLNQICSIYTFTIKNPIENTDLPLYITLNPTVNTFENLYFKVLDEDKNVVIEKTHLVDDREFTLDEEGNKVYAPNSKISPVILTNLNKTLSRATKDENTGEVIPTEVTYSIVMWILEIHDDQTEQDSSKMFSGGLTVSASGTDGKITGTFGTNGTEK